MNRAGITARVSRGLGRAAAVLGAEFDHYRPAQTGGAFATGTYLGRVRAAIDDDLTFNRKARFGDFMMKAAMQTEALRVGDYLRGDDGTFFVAALPPVGVPHVVRCNRTLTVKRPSPGTVGDGYYGGDVRAAEVTILTNWPAACIQGGSGSASEAGLPGDARGAWWQIYLPASASAQIRASDVAEDDQATPMRYIVASAEETDLGWRIRAQLAVA